MAEIGFSSVRWSRGGFARFGFSASSVQSQLHTGTRRVIGRISAVLQPERGLSQAAALTK